MKKTCWKKTFCYADWVINADELWYAPSGNLKSELASTTGNVLVCEAKSVYPEEGKPFWQWNQTVEPVPDPGQYNLSAFSLFPRQNQKVILRSTGYIQISMGNHKVAMLPKRKAASSIRIYHYNIRGRQPFLNKMINGGKQLEQNPRKHGGRHWRYFYPVLKTLLSMLDDERNDVYLHVDKRANELSSEVSRFKMKKAGFYMLENPMKVCWGDISQVKVEYRLFEAALSHGPYAYYHLLSGVDLPIQSQDYIHSFFSANEGKEFVGFWQCPVHQRDLERKVSRYYLFTERLKGGGLFFALRFVSQS